MSTLGNRFPEELARLSYLLGESCSLVREVSNIITLYNIEDYRSTRRDVRQSIEYIRERAKLINREMGQIDGFNHVAQERDEDSTSHEGSSPGELHRSLARAFVSPGLGRDEAEMYVPLPTEGEVPTPPEALEPTVPEMLGIRFSQISLMTPIEIEEMYCMEVPPSDSGGVPASESFVRRALRRRWRIYRQAQQASGAPEGTHEDMSAIESDWAPIELRDE